MAECKVELPPLANGEEEAWLVRSAPVAPSRRRAVEDLLDSVEEALASREPIIVVVVGEWGEGKTAAWHAFVKPRLREAGVETIEVRAAALAEVMARASWIVSPGWRLLTSIAAIVMGGSIPGDYRAAVSKLLERGRLAVFIDEVEDLTYREGMLEALLEGLHALIDGEVPEARVHFYLSVSPTAYAKMASWVAWRRFRRRIRVVELKPLYRGEMIEALMSMLRAACGGCMPVEDPRLLNAVVEVSKGNLGTLAAYTRRILAAWLRRRCKPLSVGDVVRILSEPMVAGVLSTGLDLEVLREYEEKYGEPGVAALLALLLNEEEGKSLGDMLLEGRACRGNTYDDSVFIDADGNVVSIRGAWAQHLAAQGGFVSTSAEVCNESGESVVWLPKIEHIRRVYGSHDSIADFIPDENLRRQALREAYRDPRYAAKGLAALLCLASWRCRTCNEIEGSVVLETHVKGSTVRIAIVPSGIDIAGLTRLTSSLKPHVIVALGDVGRVAGLSRIVRLDLDPITLMKLGALGFVTKGCKPTTNIDVDKIALLSARLEMDHEITRKIVESLTSGDCWLYLPSFTHPPHIKPEVMVDIVRLVGLLVKCSIEDIVVVAGKLGLHLKSDHVEMALRHLAKLGVIVEENGRYRVALSPPERGVLKVLEHLGGKARVEEVARLMVAERGWGKHTAIWIHLLAAKGYIQAPKRLVPRSLLHIKPLDILRGEASAAIKQLPEELREPREVCSDELCERAWLASIIWAASRVRENSERSGHGEESVVSRVAGTTGVTTDLLETRVQGVEPLTASAGREAGGVDTGRLEVFSARLLEALRLVPYALQTGRLEELAASVLKAKESVARGKVDDGIAILNDAVVSVVRAPDTLLIETVKRIDPDALEQLSLIEDPAAKRRAMEKLIAMKIARVVEKSMARLQARLVLDTRLG
ncbi:hypothetical protein Pyrfu_0074 [Pyrolobus fumarii 1A]|uniref:Uncharacterized protein n=1 Tax=Pyrolobus fumarii (strain DSM 11204 / 1A) TaxID=694429 RepID=G0EE30_PYRF1|nr:ATP-binding protein [Pyrolobus fumarii]AEM37946.1 hypothetical protein Pyrfu_0074 [Pyrolobus fumarii 1A]